MEKKKTTELIKESLAELKYLERSVTQGLVRDRVRFIRLLKQDSSLSIPAAAEKAGGYKKSWGYSIWKLYEQKGIAAVSLYPFPGTQPRLGKEDEQKLLAALKDDTVHTLHPGQPF